MKKIIYSLILTTLTISTLVGCKRATVVDKDISIIYTTDVHCGLDKYLGYASLVSYKEKIEKDNYVALVDAGDFLQGEYVGAISKGKYIIDVMNAAKYDVVTLGNHEFDYGMDELKDRLNEFNGEIVSCNVSYTGHKENKLAKVKQYTIKEYGHRKVGFVGVTTPTTLNTSEPKHFIEDSEIVYSFGAPDADSFYSLVQTNIDNCKNDGADYIVLLSHLGSYDNYAPYRSIDVIKHTSGVDVVLDGHAHADLPWTTCKNKNNEDIYYVDTGYKLNEFANFTIKLDGSFTYEFINSYDDKSESMTKLINDINNAADEQGKAVVANIDVDLSIYDENNYRLVRVRETPIGNLISDAYRYYGEADIGIVNGGGIRDSLTKGDVTYKDIQNVHPFGNSLCKKKTTGAKILDYLEFTCKNVDSIRVKDDHPYGEFGGFASVSGLKYTVDTSIVSSVEVDASGAFVKVTGPRRVKDVQVLMDDAYVPINPEQEYTIASHNFLLESGGDGANLFINDVSLPTRSLFDYEVLINYIVDVCEGHLADKYSSTEGRIVIN